jgi:hypothetical protein
MPCIERQLWDILPEILESLNNVRLHTVAVITGDRSRSAPFNGVKHSARIKLNASRLVSVLERGEVHCAGQNIIISPQGMSD